MNHLESGNNYESQINTTEATIKSLDEIWKNKEAAKKVLEANRDAEKIHAQESGENNIDKTIDAEIAELDKKNTEIDYSLPVEKHVNKLSFWEKMGFGKKSETEANLTAMNNIMDDAANQLGPSAMNGFDAIA